MRGPRKVDLKQCVRQGETSIWIYCVSERGGPRRHSHAVNVCGHHRAFPVDDIIARVGEDTSLSDIRAVCTVCGGRDVDVRARRPHQPGQRWI